MIGIVTQNTALGQGQSEPNGVSNYQNRDLPILWISMSHYMRQIQLKTVEEAEGGHDELAKRIERLLQNA